LSFKLSIANKAGAANSNTNKSRTIFFTVTS
jgi:hypothetical protein